LEPAPDPTLDDNDAFVAVFLRHRLVDRQAGVQRTLDDYRRLYPARAALVEHAWRECEGTAEPSHSALAQIGPYRLLRRLGQGGQGEVWLGDDQRLGRKVAIKLLRGVAFATDDGLLRFRREAEVASRLDHPGICPVYDAGFDAGMPYLVMRYLDGESLADALPRLVPQAGAHSQAQLRRVASLVERLGRALHAAHTAGVLHRDVKPQNVMLSGDDTPVLLDFGLARLVDDVTLFTRTGDRLGTPAYLAPEQLERPGTAHDTGADVYALGVVLYECLTGRRPFDAPTLDSLYRRILGGSAPTVRTCNAVEPRDLVVIVATAMNRDPRRRYATAATFADDLQRWLEHRPILARPAGPLVRLHRWWQRSPALATAILALFLSLAIGFWVSLGLWRAATREGQRATTLLDEWERLADKRRLDHLVDEAESTLWPAVPGNVPAMDAWLARARPLVHARLPEHRRALERLEAARAAGESDEVAWRREQLEELVAGLDALATTSRYAPTVHSVERRRQWAAELTALTLETPAAKWSAAVERVAHEPRYGGLVLTPQVGLVPLGLDPQSGLEEFADPATGVVPERDAAGALVRNETTAVVFVLLPGGGFTMGAQKADPAQPNYDPMAIVTEGPVHRVELSAFFLSKYEMTRAQWQTIMGDDPSDQYKTGQVVRGIVIDRRHPVTNTSWLSCDTITSRCGWVLPTEAQWEYACRAGTTTPWATGDDEASLFAQANLADGASSGEFPSDWPHHPGVDDGHSAHAPVGSYAANRFGLHDMHGNVREWCRDGIRHYGRDIAQPGTGERGGSPPGMRGDTSGLRIERGGSYRDVARDLRSSGRSYSQVGTRAPTLGLRPARLLSP
jgi:serine/threonine protein kinase/formylglycine-generating enzyme required for sulfatase activity